MHYTTVVSLEMSDEPRYNHFHIRIDFDKKGQNIKLAICFLNMMGKTNKYSFRFLSNIQLFYPYCFKKQNVVIRTILSSSQIA